VFECGGWNSLPIDISNTLDFNVYLLCFMFFIHLYRFMYTSAIDTGLLKAI